MSKANLVPFLEARQKQLCLEVNGGDAIDVKLLGLLASNIAILIFAAQASLTVSRWTTTLVALLLASSLLDFVALWPRKYSGTSVSALEHPEYLTYEEQQLASQLIADTEAAIKNNRRLNERRLRYVAGSLLATIVASSILLILL